MSDKRGLDDTVADDPASEEATWSLPGYELGEVIGRGGMGEVRVARDAQIDREVAGKRMRGDHPAPELVARFLREAKIQARLDHPAIVPVHELGTDEHGQPYFTMKRLAGTTLKDRLGAGPVQPLLRALVDVCFAIDLAHTRGIVHRDLKPSNIMIGDYNDVYVLDWGIARELATSRRSEPAFAGDSLDGLTGAGTLLGTPGYMAPEQMRGDAIGTPADVYALGAILFEILAGEPLHPGGQGALASTLTSPTASPAQRRADRAVAPELDTLCIEALAEDPAARPSARRFAERLQQYLDGDRDLERRRALAAEQLASARVALASQDPAQRQLAAQAASRALALDPDSTEAAQLVAQLILEPPRELPAELRVALESAERDFGRKRSRRAVPAFLAIFLWAATLPFVEVSSWASIAVLVGACVAMAGLSWFNWKTGRLPGPVVLLGNTVVAVLLAQLASPFVLLPMLVCGQVLLLATNSWIEERPLVVLLWMVATLLLPFPLEALGVLAPTWRMTPDGLLTFSAMVSSHRTIDLYFVIFGQIVLGMVVGAFGLVVTRSRRTAQRTAYIQAWHLERMILPRPPARLP